MALEPGESRVSLWADFINPCSAELQFPNTLSRKKCVLVTDTTAVRAPEELVKTMSPPTAWLPQSPHDWPAIKKTEVGLTLPLPAGDK
jgi:hypothetical protein